jgi:aspartate aminotransferase-like enzyme
LSVKYPEEKWNFNSIFSYCKNKGFIIYSSEENKKEKYFRLGVLGDLKEKHIKKFISIYKKSLKNLKWKENKNENK